MKFIISYRENDLYNDIEKWPASIWFFKYVKAFFQKMSEDFVASLPNFGILFGGFSKVPQILPASTLVKRIKEKMTKISSWWHWSKAESQVLGMCTSSITYLYICNILTGAGICALVKKNNDNALSLFFHKLLMNNAISLIMQKKIMQYSS